MAGELIFIVEDEAIVAEDLRRMLEAMGYQVVGSASRGDEAILKIEAAKPHLVLMDIRIQGSLDGVDVAEHVIAESGIPVVYLTAYADEATLGRAKGTLPLGYLLKPFDERSLKATIELALYRHSMDWMTNNIEEWRGGLLESLSVAVMAIDDKSSVTYMNKSAEALMGRDLDTVFGKPLADFCLLQNGAPDHLPSSFIVENQGNRRQIHCKASNIRDSDGKARGTAFVLEEAPSQSSPLPSPR